MLDLNAREAMHLIELRSGREGHPTYRAVAQAMHERIAAVHPARRGGDEPRRHLQEPRLERILSEIRTQRKRSGAGTPSRRSGLTLSGRALSASGRGESADAPPPTGLPSVRRVFGIREPGVRDRRRLSLPADGQGIGFARRPRRAGGRRGPGRAAGSAR